LPIFTEGHDAARGSGEAGHPTVTAESGRSGVGEPLGAQALSTIGRSLTGRRWRTDDVLTDTTLSGHKH